MPQVMCGQLCRTATQSLLLPQAVSSFESESTSVFIALPLKRFSCAICWAMEPAMRRENVLVNFADAVAAERGGLGDALLGDFDRFRFRLRFRLFGLRRAGGADHFGAGDTGLHADARVAAVGGREVLTDLISSGTTSLKILAQALCGTSVFFRFIAVVAFLAGLPEPVAAPAE